MGQPQPWAEVDVEAGWGGEDEVCVVVGQAVGVLGAFESLGITDLDAGDPAAWVAQPA